MINDFEVLKKQLKELSTVINSFKSEAVQLRLIELVFQTSDEESDGPKQSPPKKARKSSTKKKSKKGVSKKANRSGKRPGGKVMLDTLIKEGFFKKPKTIKQIVTHCDKNKALKYEQSAFSGALGRLVRDKTLKRSKNKDKQYEYVEA